MGCHQHFSVTAGTIFHDSHLPLWKWFRAIYLITESKKGVSACQIQRNLAVSCRTAWYLCHRLRAAVKDASLEFLRGIVEVDETYVGGKVRGMGRGYQGNKAIAVGAGQRGGILGAIIGGLIAGLYVGWQTRELARHNLRAIIIKMGVYVQQCKGMTDGKGDYGRTEPWTVYMDEAIACYLRFRAISLPWNRSALDRALDTIPRQRSC